MVRFIRPLVRLAHRFTTDCPTRLAELREELAFEHRDKEHLQAWLVATEAERDRLRVEVKALEADMAAATDELTCWRRYYASDVPPAR